jgi:hypothetical protein
MNKNHNMHYSKSEPNLHSKLTLTKIEPIHHSNSDPNISIKSTHINKSKTATEKIEEFEKFIRNDMNKFIPDKKYLDSFKI